MSDTNRFLKVRNNPNTDMFFDWIDERYFSYNLGTQTPIPNQALPTDINESGNATTIYFTAEANTMINSIREIDHTISSMRASNNIADKPIEYVCYGYRDFNGDIVIEHIDVPVFETLIALNLPNDRMKYEFLAFDTSATAKSHKIEITSRIYEHLRHTKRHPDGKEIVALFGTTKHPNKNDNTSNCFTLKEFADATMPYKPVQTNIISGVISITPKTIEAQRINKDASHISAFLTPGAIECALISYHRNEHSGLTIPNGLTNITEAYGMDKSGKLNKIKISCSNQPVDNIPNYQYRKQELTMNN